MNIDILGVHADTLTARVRMQTAAQYVRMFASRVSGIDLGAPSSSFVQ